MIPLSKELWAEVKPLLAAALDLSPDERPAWLEGLRRRSPGLAREVAALLRAAPTDLDHLFAPAQLGDLLGQGLAGQIVGGYTMERPIGRGGMGTVWLARRSDGRFEGLAAVKLLNLGLLGQVGERRFRNEGTALARLIHPNIARLYDAGVTSGGQPFLTLEYVDGEAIDRYADRLRLSLEQRIRLMIDVLTAVGTAHASLIVHRDIKPSNILVTRDGRVKLLDFGIARMLSEGRSDQATTLTDPGQGALTPEYGAPEMVTGQAVSTATDVYSAGVLLYWLVSGTHPTSRKGDTAASAIAAVVEREPTRLSDAIQAGPPEARATRAALRGTSAQALARACRGDLDHIVAQALRKVPGERYPTAMAFADDLRRLLHHEPVSAVAESVGYRAGKFVRRHRIGVLAALVGLLTLIGGGAFSVRQMIIARRERDRAEGSRKRTEASVAFESLLFRLLQPGGPALTYEQLLAKGREALEREYRGEPASRIQLGITFAQNYLRGNEPAAAREIIERTVRVADSLGDREQQARTRCELAAVYVALRAPDSALGRVLEGRRLLSAVRDPDVANRDACDFAEGQTRYALNERDSAVAIFGAMVTRLKQSGDTTRTAYLEALNNLARALNGSGRMRESREILFRVIRAVGDGQTADPGTRGVVLYNAALVFDALGEFQDARRYLGRELARAFAADSVAVDAANLYDYAMFLDQLGEGDSAAYWFGRAIANPARIDDARVFTTHLMLAHRAEVLGSGDSARVHRRLAQPFKPIMERSTPARAAWIVDRIRLARSGGDGAVVAATVRAEFAAMGYSADSRAQRISLPLAEAAAALIATGRYAQALPYAEHLERLGSRDSLTAVRSGVVGRGLLLQAQAVLGLGDSTRARTLIDRAVAPLRAGYGERHQLTREAITLRDALGR